MGKETRNLLVNAIHDRELSRMAGLYFKGRLLDIGCGIKPYKDLLKKHVTEHIGVDYVGTIHDKSQIDIISTAYQIPQPNASFDCALCTGVLEHLEEPLEALKECHRILKPEGCLVLSAPFIWHLHEEPRDFYRYSRYGLEYLFTKAGFDVLELKALSGFWATFGQLFVYNLYRLNRGPLRWLRIIDIAGLLVQGMAYILDKLDKTERWTWMYMIAARKR